MGDFRIVRSFGNNITPSSEKAYRVESTHQMSERDALQLRLDLNENRGEAVFRAVLSFGINLSNDNAFGVESVHPMSERDALSLMRDLGSPYEGARFLPNNRVSVVAGDQQQG